MDYKDISQKAQAMVEENKDFQSAAHLLRMKKEMLTSAFCEKIGEWVLDRDLAYPTPRLCRQIHNAARSIDPKCKIGNIMGTIAEVFAGFEDLLGMDQKSIDETEIWDWKGTTSGHIKVIYCIFGDVHVHFWIQPYGDVGEDACEASARFDCHVYSPTGKGKMLYARSSSYWDRTEDDERYPEKIDDTKYWVGQVGDMNQNLKTYGVVLGTALALVFPEHEGDIQPISHCIENDDLCIVKDIGAALKACGKGVAENIQKENDEPAVMKVLPA